MPDAYQAVRSLPFSVVAEALGADLSKYKTRKSGQEFYGPCLIHGPKTNTTSFSYNVAGQWHCFSCNAKGKGAIDVVKAARSLNFTQAVEFLTPYATNGQAKEKPAQRAESRQSGGSDARANTQPLAEAGTEGSSSVLTPFKGSYDKFAVPCPWLEQRIPNADIRTRYGVFCYNNPARKSAYTGRVLIPIKDLDGQLFGYLARSVQPEHEPKYLFPRDFPKSRFLFGAYELRQHLSGLGTGRSVYQHVFLVESPFCVMKFASLGIPAVSPFGWSVSDEQELLLQALSRGVVYLPDRNKQNEAASVVPVIARRLWLRFPPLPSSIHDPEELSLEQIQALAR